MSSVGLALEATGLVAVAFTGADTPLPFVAGAFALVGVGLGLFTVPNLLFVMGSIPRDRQGVAGALSQMMRMVGVVAGVAGATLLFDARRSTHVADLAVPADDPTAFVAAYRDTFVAVAALCAVAIAVSLLRPSRDRALAALIETARRGSVSRGSVVAAMSPMTGGTGATGNVDGTIAVPGALPVGSVDEGSSLDGVLAIGISGIAGVGTGPGSMGPVNNTGNGAGIGAPVASGKPT